MHQISQTLTVPIVSVVLLNYRTHPEEFSLVLTYRYSLWVNFFTQAHAIHVEVAFNCYVCSNRNQNCNISHLGSHLVFLSFNRLDIASTQNQMIRRPQNIYNCCGLLHYGYKNFLRWKPNKLVFYTTGPALPFLLVFLLH